MMFTINIKGQNNQLYVGNYIDLVGNDTLTLLSLDKDGGFTLMSYDRSRPGNFEKKYSEGNWSSIRDTVILNPEKQKLIPNVRCFEDIDNQSDSLMFIIDYSVHYYKKENLTDTSKVNFEVLTLYINKKSKPLHLIRLPYYQDFDFSQKHRNKIFINSQNIFKVKKDRVNKIGVFTYGFDEIIWNNLTNSESNIIKINIIHPIDYEFTPRSEKVLIKRGKAYYYKNYGEIDKCMNPLIKQGLN